MPIIPRVGRKSVSVRATYTLIYAVLAVGAAVTVYPFLLMLSTSVTSSTDVAEFRVIPRFLTHEQPLLAKYVDEKYNGDIDDINARYHTDLTQVSDVPMPPGFASERNRALAAQWQSFSASLPLSWKVAGFRGYGIHPSVLSAEYQDYLRGKFRGNIQALNAAYTEENDTFETVNPPLERVTKQDWVPDASRKMTDFLAWKATLPANQLIVSGVEPLWSLFLRDDVDVYGGSVAKARAIWGAHKAFDEIALSAEPPAPPGQRRDWEAFVRTSLPFRYVIVSPLATNAYRDSLVKRYGTITGLNHTYGTRYARFTDVPLPRGSVGNGASALDWSQFLKIVPVRMLRIDTPENRFRAYLARNKIRTDTSGVFPPYLLTDALYVHDHAALLRSHDLTRNYAIVIDFLLLHGRALVVTAIFCLAAIFTTVTINPFCAYALSRFNLPYSHRVLVFLLATMAFPAEVAMIPNFLMIKQFGMLNTYWALVLPGAANGFSIFLLKGFFDSLPKELYEAGTIDGASEIRMFWNIALPLSGPIFAVIALGAFTDAYTAFMFAMLVCQDDKMWTVMVWLYQLQISNPPYILMAAFTVLSLPMLLMFIFAQNIILRGLVVPTEK